MRRGKKPARNPEGMPGKRKKRKRIGTALHLHQVLAKCCVSVKEKTCVFTVSGAPKRSCRASTSALVLRSTTPSSKPSFCPTNACFMTKRYLKSTPSKFYIERKNDARFEHYMFSDAHPSPQSNAAFDYTECTDDAVARDFNGSVYTCCRMDHGNFHRLHYF